MTRKEEVTSKIVGIVKDKNTRNIFFLIASIFVVLAINSLLPIIEGSSHYTEAPEEMTYIEYKQKSEENNNYNLTWASNRDINRYIDAYCEDHNVPKSERYNVIPPDNFKVKVYTQFFFQHIYWWVSTLTHVVSILLIYYSVFNYLLSKRKQTYSKYLNLKEEIDNAVESKLDPNTFEPWMVHTFNKKRKEDQHKLNIKYKLDLLKRRTSYKIRTAPKDNPKYQRYEKKKKLLEEQLTPEYIEQYLPSKRVKGFTYIHPTFVTSGYNVIGLSTDSYSLLNSDSQRIGKDGIRKTITSILITTMFAVLLTFTVGASIDQPWYWVVINVITKLVPMSIQIPAAYDYRDSFMENHLITNLISRRNIILLYLADLVKIKPNNETQIMNSETKNEIKQEPIDIENNEEVNKDEQKDIS